MPSRVKEIVEISFPARARMERPATAAEKFPALQMRNSLTLLCSALAVLCLFQSDSQFTSIWNWIKLLNLSLSHSLHVNKSHDIHIVIRKHIEKVVQLLNIQLAGDPQSSSDMRTENCRQFPKRHGAIAKATLYTHKRALKSVFKYFICRDEKKARKSFPPPPSLGMLMMEVSTFLVVKKKCHSHSLGIVRQGKARQGSRSVIV